MAELIALDRLLDSLEDLDNSVMRAIKDFDRLRKSGELEDCPEGLYTLGGLTAGFGLLISTMELLNSLVGMEEDELDEDEEEEDEF